MIDADPDDDKFADVAFASGADYLISNNNHFNVLKKREHPKIHVLRLDEFRVLMGY